MTDMDDPANGQQLETEDRYRMDTDDRMIDKGNG